MERIVARDCTISQYSIWYKSIFFNDIFSLYVCLLKKEVKVMELKEGFCSV